MSGNGMMSFFPTNFTLQHDDLHPILPPSPPQHFHGVASFTGKRSMSFSGIDHICEETTTNGEEDLSDDGSQSGEKKRRLNIDQVKTLEKNFELGNKLDPERKMQLSRALGLQPRQIAIWFQNRRARWKTKQLEKDYDKLKRQFESLKADNDSLQAENQQLQAEIMALKGREHTESINLNKETEGSSSNRSENSSDDINLDISRAPAPIGIGMTQLFQQNSPNPNHHHHNQQHQSVKEESFTNIFSGGEDQSGLWPWLEQHHFN